MTLTQPVVGSTGWGEAVNQNFADIEAFCNALYGQLLAGVAVGAFCGAQAQVGCRVECGNATLGSGVMVANPSASVVGFFAYYQSRKSAATPPLIVVADSGHFDISNGDAGDSESVVAWVALSPDA